MMSNKRIEEDGIVNTLERTYNNVSNDTRFHLELIFARQRDDPCCFSIHPWQIKLTFVESLRRHLVDSFFFFLRNLTSHYTGTSNYNCYVTICYVCNCLHTSITILVKRILIGDPSFSWNQWNAQFYAQQKLAWSAKGEYRESLWIVTLSLRRCIELCIKKVYLDMHSQEMDINIYSSVLYIQKCM
jgi:hypothetical protein